MRLPFEMKSEKNEKNDDEDKTSTGVKDEKSKKDNQGKKPPIGISSERIEVTVYPNQSKDIEEILKEYSIHYIKTNGESYDVACIHYIIIAPREIISILIDLISAKLDTKQRINVITQYKTESTISEYLTKLLKSYIDEDKIKIKSNKHDGPIESLIAKTDSFFSKQNDTLIMILIATTVALVGLITNNVAVIIGGMLISPLIGPISSFSLNSILGRRTQINKSIIFAIKMLVSSIALAALMTFVISLFTEIPITPEIQSRVNVSPLLIIFAIVLGIGGGLAILTSSFEIIVGVAIAVALVPPASVCGIGIGIGSFEIAYGSFLVLMSNIIGIIIGFMGIFLIKGVSPRKYYEKQRAKEVFRINIMIMSILAILLAIIEIFFPSTELFPNISRLNEIFPNIGDIEIR